MPAQPAVLTRTAARASPAISRFIFQLPSKGPAPGGEPPEGDPLTCVPHASRTIQRGKRFADSDNLLDAIRRTWTVRAGTAAKLQAARNRPAGGGGGGGR